MILRMRTAVVLSLLVASMARAEDAPAIRLDSVGYLPGRAKRATIAAPAKTFRVIRAEDGSLVLEGRIAGPVKNADTGEDLVTADFSELNAPGIYRIEAPDAGRSADFRVAGDVYREPFAVVTRGMYLWRCGTAVRGSYRGDVFSHEACHLEDAWLDVVEGKHERRDSTRGWHDAGDYNKYVVNAGVTVGAMLRAWEDFGPAIGRVPLELPETGGNLPDFLAEVRWELEWLLTMQATDGAVLHKVSTKSFGKFLPPEEEKEPRFFVPRSTAATADFVAMMAMASRSFRPYDPTFADRCLAAARKGDAYLRAHPHDHQADQKGFKTGEYGTPDADDRLWASAEL